jgi:hypothetical protein
MTSVTVRAVSNRRGTAIGLVVLAAVAAVIVAALLVVRGSELPAANSGYSTTIGDGITPTTSAAHAAAVARHYLDEQTPDLAAPGIHVDPVVSAVSAVRAADASTLEPRIPAQAVAEDTRRAVWVVAVSGDFLNLHDLAWSLSGTPWPNGTMVIDDAMALHPSILLR